MKKVLVVEDSRFVRAVLQQRLSEQGHTVITAVDGETGLKLATEAIPDVIVIDWIMPKIQGSTLLASLRANPLTAKIPVLVVSGSISGDATENALLAGAFGVLAKSDTVVADIVSTLAQPIPLLN